MKKYLIKIGCQFYEIIEDGKPEGCTMDTKSMLALAAMLVVFAILAAVAP